MFGSRYQQDFIMRQIELITKFIAESVFKKESPEYDIIKKADLSATEDLHNKLVRMIEEDKINEAENLLFDMMDTDNKEYLEVALDFYSRLTKLEDIKLEKNDFTNEVIAQGVLDISSKFGMDVNV